jgi:RHS repeat-associated protein
VDYGDATCDPVLPLLSLPAEVATALWGDVAGPWDSQAQAWGPPDGTVDTNDMTACLDAFKNQLWAPPFHCADVLTYKCDPDPDVLYSSQVDILDCSAVIDAFLGTPYDGYANTCPRPCDPAEAASVPWHPKNPYYFTGRRLDFNIAREQTGGVPPESAGDPLLTLYHYRARAYDPTHGRFLQRDPAGYVDGMSLYEYVSSRPLYGRDPSGLDSLDSLSNFMAGVGDALSMGLTRFARQALDHLYIDDIPHSDLVAPDWGEDPSTKLYKLGEVVETAVEITVSAGGAYLKKKAAQRAGRKWYRELVGDTPRKYRRQKNRVKAKGYVHHHNPIRGHPVNLPGGGQGSARFPLPFTFAGQSKWNMTWVRTRSAHLAAHRRQMTLDGLDKARQATLFARQGLNALAAHLMSNRGHCWDYIDIDWSIEADTTLIGTGGSQYAETSEASFHLGRISALHCHARRR